MSDPGNTYIRKGTRISKISSEDVNKSAAIATFERDSEKSRDFHFHFGLMIDSEDKLYNYNHSCLPTMLLRQAILNQT